MPWNELISHVSAVPIKSDQHYPAALIWPFIFSTVFGFQLGQVDLLEACVNDLINDNISKLSILLVYLFFWQDSYPPPSPSSTQQALHRLQWTSKWFWNQTVRHALSKAVSSEDR
jgi:hypothetical protein